MSIAEDGVKPAPALTADGASAARTRLAWRRTVLATTAVTALTIRLAARGGFTPLRAVAIALALATWLAQLLIAQRRIRAMAVAQPRDISRTLPTVALATTAYAAVGLMLVLSGS